MRNKIRTRMNLAALRVRAFLAEEKGEGHLIAVAVVALVVLAVAIIFRNKITEVITNLTDKIGKQADTF